METPTPSATEASAEAPAALEPGTRQHVLRAAARLFAERGFDAVSVREIVQAAGVTKPALYYYFGSKEGLALEIIRDFMQAADAVRQEAFSNARDVRDALVRHFNGMMQLAAGRKQELAFGFACWFGRSSIRQLADKTSEYDCKVNGEWMQYLQANGLDVARAGNVVRVFWALLMQELLRVVHCPYWESESGETAQVIASLVLDGALGGTRDETGR